jgi:hypothetical protein
MSKVFIILFIALSVIGIAVAYYWLFIGTGMNLNRGKFCTQVIVTAKNPISGVAKSFGNPCSVPMGWVVTNPFDLQ